MYLLEASAGCSPTALTLSHMTTYFKSYAEKGWGGQLALRRVETLMSSAAWRWCKGLIIQHKDRSVICPKSRAAQYVFLEGVFCLIDEHAPSQRTEVYHLAQSHN